MPINNTSKEKVIFYRNQTISRPLYIKLLKVDGLIIVDSKERERCSTIYSFFFFFFK